VPPLVTGPMDCNELVQLVTAYLEGSLDPDMRARFDLHLLECDGCDNYLQQFRVTIESPGQAEDDELDPAYRDKLLNTFRDWRQSPKTQMLQTYWRKFRNKCVLGELARDVRRMPPSPGCRWLRRFRTARRERSAATARWC